MTNECAKFLDSLDADANEARRLDSVALMEGCYLAVREELVARDGELEALRARLAQYVEQAREALLSCRAGPPG
jgi:hypothetical protein